MTNEKIADTIEPILQASGKPMNGVGISKKLVNELEFLWLRHSRLKACPQWVEGVGDCGKPECHFCSMEKVLEQIREACTEWHDEVPTEPGEYWFYGWMWGEKTKMNGSPKSPELDLVVVRKIANGAMYYAAKNTFLDVNKCIGMWAKFIPPELPDLKQ